MGRHVGPGWETLHSFFCTKIRNHSVTGIWSWTLGFAFLPWRGSTA
jgi:hypothetical protein